MKTKSSSIRQLGTMIVLGIMVLGPMVVKADPNLNPKILPLNSTPYNDSYGNWGAKWWQWALLMPNTSHPLFDTADCSTNQSGQVWFLGGTFTQSPVGPGVVKGEANRTCNIPAGKALFIPLINTEASTVEGNGNTETELLVNATDIINHTTALQAEIDGVQVKNLWAYRAHSSLFTWGPLPENNLLQAIGEPIPAGTISEAVADGYYMMLAPLSGGPHTVRFSSVLTYTKEKDGFDFQFLLNITYNINISKT